MSDGERMSLSFATVLAGKVVDELGSVCERIEIAGSIRRKKPTIGDVEIVCIPKLVTMTNLLGETITKREPDDIAARLIVSGFRLLKNGDHFKQAQLADGGVKFDIFITTPECWGVIFTIRTGSADFSHRLVTTRQQGGLLPSNLRVKDGRIWHGETALSTPEESDVFAVLGMAWIDPEQRG